MIGHIKIEVSPSDDGRDCISVDTELHRVGFADKVGIIDSVQKALNMSDEEFIKAIALKKLFYKAETVTVDMTKLRQGKDD